MKLLLILFFVAQVLYAVENYELFGQFQSLYGTTGNILNPSTEVLDRKKVSLGLNKFNVGVTYGLFKNFELGVHFNLKELTPIKALDSENLERKLDELSFHSKLKILSGDGLNFAVGHMRSIVYCVFGRYFPEFYDITFEGGVRIKYWTEPGEKIKIFMSLLQTQSGHRFIYDFEDTNGLNSFGWRFLLSPEVALDLFLNDFLRYRTFFDNFYFGVSIVWE